jgi:4-diphosphocytidyl-2-C-methyl-D-erythritol kinase
MTNSAVTIESPTRVTLALDIIRKLDGAGPLCGYHELGIVKHQIALADTLRVEFIGEAHPRDIVECADPRVPCDASNICVKACDLIREKFKRRGFFRISIDKRIPVMGGMAGGSANAAAALRALDEIWGLGLAAGQFRELGKSLGMDVPFFFDGKTAFDSESTGVLEPINTGMKLHIAIAVPEIGVSTKEAYGLIDYTQIAKNVSLTGAMISALKNNDFNGVVKSMHNDFEIHVFKKYPRLKELRDNLLKAGCPAACMSGSGSTIIGIAEDKRHAEKIAGMVDCRVIVTETLG